jgi:hypothetical protein
MIAPIISWTLNESDERQGYLLRYVDCSESTIATLQQGSVFFRTVTCSSVSKTRFGPFKCLPLLLSLTAAHGSLQVLALAQTIPRSPRRFGHESWIRMQVDDIVRVLDLGQQLALFLVRLARLQNGGRRWGVTGKNHLIVLTTHGGSVRIESVCGFAGILSLPRTCRNGLALGNGCIQEYILFANGPVHGRHVLDRPVPHREPLRPVEELEHPVIAEETDELCRRELLHILEGRAPQRRHHREQIVPSKGVAVPVLAQVVRGRDVLPGIVGVQEQDAGRLAVEADHVAEEGPER